jgi:hypothetical protein
MTRPNVCVPLLRRPPPWPGLNPGSADRHKQRQKSSAKRTSS